MAQDSIQITTTPPLPGITLVQQINAALQALATDFSGASDPGALAGPFMTWADTGTLTIKRRNAAGTEWVIEGRLLCNHLPIFAQDDVPTSDIGPIYIIGKGPAEWAVSQYKVLLPDIPSNDDLQWLGTPIGGYITPFTAPPRGNPLFRYVICSAGHTGPGGYNEGVLSNESVSGTAPLVMATALVSMASSTMNGTAVRLINTEGRFVGAGSSESIENDSMQRITGNFAMRRSIATTAVAYANGALKYVSGNSATGTNTESSASGVITDAIELDSAFSPDSRSSNKTQPRTHRLPHYRRIM